MSSTNEARFAAWRSLLRQRLLQWAFPLTMTWLLFFVLMTQTEGLLRMNPFPEGGMPHRFFEDWVEPFAAVVILAAIIGLHYRLLRRWPSFLRLPESAPLFATVIRLVVHGVGLFVIITASTVFIAYRSYDPATDPQGQFHIWVWGGGFLYALWFTPTVALFTAWWAVKRKHGDGAR